MNNKGQFSIIAALLVAVVLIASVIGTYSAIRYSPIQEQPQILSSIDETNQALKQLLGFTVGYYGSVLKVTGNVTYAQMLAQNYFDGGIGNLGSIKPEWGLALNTSQVELKANWFTNDSYSQGSMNVTYDLNGLGITGASYSASCRLEVQVSNINSTTQAQFKILTDNNEPLINLGANNLKFFRYVFGNLTWDYSTPTNVISHADGTYIVDLPSGVSSTAYVLQVEDIRGLSVLAASYNKFTSSIAWNKTAYKTDLDYVDSANLNITGTHGNFTAQKYGPDNIYDTLTEAASGVTQVPSYPTNYNTYGSTTLASGSTGNLQVNDGNYLSFHAYTSSFGAPANFGYTSIGSTSSDLTYVTGSRFTLGASNGLATSVSAYLGFTGSSNTFGNTGTGSSGNTIEDTIRGQRFTSPANPVVAQSISAYIYCTTTAKNMKAALYDTSGNLIATTNQNSVPASASPAWQTFNFASPPTLTANTQYVLVVWSQLGTGSGDLRYSSPTGGNGRSLSQSYGTWPSSPAFSTNTIQYSIYCNYLTTTFKAQAAIYSGTGGTIVGTTEEKTLTTTNGWVTFNFITQPTLTASANYVLAIESSDTSVTMYYNSGAEYFRASPNYPTWPTPISDQFSQRQYSIYCTYSPANQYTAQVELIGNSTAPLPWSDLTWVIDSSTSTSSVATTFQLYNWGTDQYPISGDGYMTASLSSGDTTKTQTIVASPANFLNSSGYWKVMITAVKSIATSFDLNLDMVQYSPDTTNYALNLQEQWVNVNATNLRQDLCIKTGTMGGEPLLVQVFHAGTWLNLTTLTPNYFNNVSLSPYIDSSTLTIRFVGSNEATDPIQDSWNIDSIYLQDEPDINFLVNQQQSTFTLEILQNGTMRWLGQNMQVTTQTLPIPPIPVKAIHVNQTINGVNQEVPFQIEDWASNYRIPLGLTSNNTLFTNRQMIVFLLNSQVTDFTIWWNGSDTATQTPLEYTNLYFTDNPSSQTLNNGKLKLQFATSGFVLTSTVGSVTSTSNLMRFNLQEDTTDPELSYVISNGVIRDIVLGEAEFSNGITNCSNAYTNIVITLPANVTYYTYQLRAMFLDSSPRPRNISDLSPLRLSTSVASAQIQTENSTLAGFPSVQNGNGLFANFTSGSWTAHHFSQFISSDGKGAGIVFNDLANQNLYAFNLFSASTSNGALKASTGLIELLPVSSAMVKFTYAYDITWVGAVATFDGTTPIANLYRGTTPMGLWILAEYPPTLTVVVNS
jgi:hypothetical protein